MARLSDITIFVFFTTFLCGCVSVAQADPLPVILSDEAVASKHYLPDFSYAGYGFGIQPIPSVKTAKEINVEDFGVIADDEIDDSSGVLKALEQAHSIDGPVLVLFPEGRIILTEILAIERSNIVLRGAGRGAEGTVLYFPRPLEIIGDGGRLDRLRAYLKENDKRQIEIPKNLDVLFSEYSWSGGFIWVAPPGDETQKDLIDTHEQRPVTLTDIAQGKRGERELTVANAGQLSPGQTVAINWRNDKGEGGPLVKALYGNTTVKIGSRHWDAPFRPVVRQRTEIISIEGNKVTIGSPLLHDINASLTADITIWTALREVGLEDFRIEFPESAYYGHHTEHGYNGVFFTGVYNSWTSSLSFANADSAIIIGNAANITIRDTETLGDHPAHYAVQIGNGHNILVEGVRIFNPVIHSLTFNTLATGSVYKDAEVFSTPTLDQHAGANHQNLYDNITLHIDAKRDAAGEAYYPLYDGSGAGYWQPGHGGFSTTWNLKVIVESGAATHEVVRLEGLAEGPMARIVGLSGNRPFNLDYRPDPYVEFINRPVGLAPSLYKYQQSKRK